MRSIALILPMSIVFLATGCGNDAKNQDSNEGNSDEIYTPATPNAVPQASFSSHREGDTERDGYRFVVEGTVFDADHAIDDDAASTTPKGRHNTVATPRARAITGTEPNSRCSGPAMLAARP